MPSTPWDSTRGRTTSGEHSIIAFGQHKQSNDVGGGMPSPSLDITHGQMTSGVACHHHPSTTHTVGRRRAWHDLTALGQHTQSDYVGRGMTSPPLDSAHGRTTSSATFHHLLWKAHTVERRRAWHAIITIEQHKWSNDVGHDMPTSRLGRTHSNDVGRGMPSSSLGNTNGRTTSGVA